MKKVATGSDVGSEGCELFGHGDDLFIAAGDEKAGREWPREVGTRALPLVGMPAALCIVIGEWSALQTNAPASKYGG